MPKPCSGDFKLVINGNNRYHTTNTPSASMSGTIFFKKYTT